MDLNDPDDVAQWLATDPPPHQQDQAIDDLIGVFGNERGLRIWSTGARLSERAPR
jgi:hypothetical protein